MIEGAASVQEPDVDAMGGNTDGRKLSFQVLLGPREHYPPLPKSRQVTSIWALLRRRPFQREGGGGVPLIEKLKRKGTNGMKIQTEEMMGPNLRFSRMPVNVWNSFRWLVGDD